MTARVTTLKGADAGRYYVEDLPSYYLDSGEPPGRWHGKGAEVLGLAGDVDDGAFLRLMAGEDPATGLRLGTQFCERSVRAFDITCSAPKSVSVLFGLGDDRARKEVLEAHDAAVGAVVDWIETHAHVRYRINGQVGVFDADGITAATFRQHTSRALDPQLHTHVVVPNRVLAPDGRWLALDARTIKHDQRTLSALYHAGLRAELTARLGVEWQDRINGIAEIEHIPGQLLAAFSSRSEEVDARLDDKLDRFRETFDREPTPRERWRLEREAVVDSRPAKQSVDAYRLRDEWAGRATALRLEWETGLTEALDRVPVPRPLDATDVRTVVGAALTSLTEKQSAWRPAELVRELAANLPTHLDLQAGDVGVLLDDLASRVIAQVCLDLSRPIPAGVTLRRDGRPVTESALDRVVTLPAIVAEEEHVLALAQGWVTGGGDHPRLVTGDHDHLAGDQLDVASAVAGDRRLVLVVGPAGSGKTTALRPAVRQLRTDGRVVFGVAPSATAAQVLAMDTHVDADTLDKLLTEHRLERPPRPRYDLPAGATILVDEAAMVPTPKLAELFNLADRHQWRVALVGDPLQFSAVGRAGLFGYLVDTLGAVRLGEIHRFADHWEAEASLRLRRGDQSVIDIYDRHGRLHEGTATQMRRQVIRAWWDATSNGEKAAMMAPTNEAVIVLNQRAQRLRIDAGQLDEHRSTEAGPYTLYVGDIVATRRNDRQLHTDRCLMVKNRDHWTVLDIHHDGGITVTGPTGLVRLPGDYVARHVELAYAETSHANQGRTVDRSYLLLDAATNTAGIYVPMTRGRVTNEVFVAVHGDQTAAEVVAESLAHSWVDRPAIQRRAELAEPRRTASQEPDTVLPPRVLRQLIERAHDIDRLTEQCQWQLDAAHRELRNIRHRRSALERTIVDYEARITNAKAVVAEHDRLLHRRRHRFDLGGARTQLSWTPTALDEAVAELAAVTAREAHAERQLGQAISDAAETDRLHGERSGIGIRLEKDRSARSRALGAAPTPEIIDRLGPRPRIGDAAEAWDTAAGLLDQHRAAFGNESRELAAPERYRFRDTAFTASQRAVQDATIQLAATLGQDRGIEGPSLDLSL